MSDNISNNRMRRVFLPFYWLVRALLFVFVVMVTIVIYEFLLKSIFSGSIIVPLLVLWAITAYLVLPRIHRLLTRIYLPNYYFGRTRTVDGILGDPVNLAILGTEDQLVNAMRAAGWIQAEPVSLKSSWKIAVTSLRKQSYPEAPVSPLFLFDRPQAYAFQKEVDGNPLQRHHVRFWPTPNGWHLPGGRQANWLGAGSYDTRAGLSYFTGQITHRIDPNTDTERDYIIEDLKKAQSVESVEMVKHFNDTFSTRNGGGDVVRTDGAMPFITLR